MRQSALAVALLGVMAFAACGKDRKPLPPAPPTPAPVAPATPPPAPPPPEANDMPVQDDYTRMRDTMASDEIDRMGLVKDVNFDYNSAELRDSDRQVLNDNAAALKKFDFLKVTVEGHADERGTVDYNLALSERRAQAALDYLVSLGVTADRLKPVSYGKEVPMCQDSNESCWARNRRAHFAITGKIRR